MGVVVAVAVWALAALILFSPTAFLHTDSPTSWLVVALAQLPLMLHILFWLNILQLAGRVRAGVAARHGGGGRADDRGGRAVPRTRSRRSASLVLIAITTA